MKINSCFCFLVLICFCSYGQIGDYSFKNKLDTVSEQWHKIVLPNAVLSELNSDLSDVRIYGITSNKDTIEAPYVLKSSSKIKIKEDALFEIMNVSKNGSTYFFTFKMLNDEPINQLRLNFGNSNYDWKVRLEGSQNQKEWFSLLEDYRIVSIQNESTRYSFSTLKFPNAQYKYYRIAIASDAQVNLESAEIKLYNNLDVVYRDYTILKKEVSEDKEKKQTVIALDLKERLPVSLIKINVKDKVDYYRSVSIRYITDSVSTDKGWRYNYSYPKYGTLTSIEKNEFSFNPIWAKKLQISIDNEELSKISFL